VVKLLTLLSKVTSSIPGCGTVFRKKKAMDYTNVLGTQRCAYLRDAKRSEPGKCLDNSTGCWLYTGSQNIDGYCQVWAKKNADLHKTGRGAQSGFLLHIVSWVASNPGVPHIGRHISHLCDNRTCFNPAHLVCENAQANNSRKGCIGPITCSDHGHIIVDACKHRPRCIRPARDDVRCCLTIRESDPGGWATASSQATSRRTSAQGSEVETEYEGAEWTEMAADAGWI
jgi:hypothetical protein